MNKHGESWAPCTTPCHVDTATHVPANLYPNDLASHTCAELYAEDRQEGLESCSNSYQRYDSVSASYKIWYLLVTKQCCYITILDKTSLTSTMSKVELLWWVEALSSGLQQMMVQPYLKWPIYLQMILPLEFGFLSLQFVLYFVYKFYKFILLRSQLQWYVVEKW